MSGLRVSGDGNMSNQVGKRDIREEYRKRLLERKGIWGSGKNLAQRNLMGIYKKTASKTTSNSGYVP